MKNILFLILFLPGICYSQVDSLELNLKKAKSLYDQGLINQREYDELKEKAINPGKNKSKKADSGKISADPGSQILINLYCGIGSSKYSLITPYFDLSDSRYRGLTCIGAGIEKEFGNFFSLRAGAEYNVRGWQQTYDLYDSIGKPIEKSKYAEHHNYISIAILPKITFGKKVKFYVAVGAAPSYLISIVRRVSDGQAAEGEPIKKRSPYRQDTISKYNSRFDIPILAGVGLSFDFGRNRVFIEQMNSFGMIKTLTRPVYPVGPAKHNSHSFQVGFSRQIN